MIAQLTAGNKVKFQYVKARNRNYDVFPCTTSYEVEAYEGNVLEVRDIVAKQLDKETVYRRPDIERSQFLLVVQMPDNKIKSFYDGRILNIEEVKPVSKTFLKKVIDKLTGK